MQRNLILSLVTSVSLLFAVNSPAQQRPPFSEKIVQNGDRSFLPYTAGEVERSISGPQKQTLEKLCAAITAWDSINPPQGIKVSCYGTGNHLEISFYAYLFEDGLRQTPGGPNLYMSVNTPDKLFGSPVAPGIYICPQKVTDFHGASVYQNGKQEVTVFTQKNIPLFIPVTQEEYLNALIREEEVKSQGTEKDSGVEDVLREMENAYRELLKTDREAAEEFKKQMDEFRLDSKNQAGDIAATNPAQLLKDELAGLSVEERRSPAWYSPGAGESGNRLSGLVSSENQKWADALVKPNPALVDRSAGGQIQLLIVSWTMGDDNTNADKPRLYDEGRKGFHLADNLMKELYNHAPVWQKIAVLCH